jgi:hypothetical protein
MSSGGKTLAGGGGAYNIIDKCFGGENVQMLTPLLANKSRRKHDDRTKGSNCKNWKSKLL